MATSVILVFVEPRQRDTTQLGSGYLVGKAYNLGYKDVHGLTLATAISSLNTHEGNPLDWQQVGMANQHGTR